MAFENIRNSNFLESILAPACLYLSCSCKYVIISKNHYNYVIIRKNQFSKPQI